MKLLINAAVAGCVLALAGCSHGQEAAPGTPKTDISQSSTERGAYGAGSPYYVINEARTGEQAVIDVNVTDLGRADDIGRKVVNDKKGNAKTVTVHVFAPDEKPPHAPAKTIEWSADKGFSEAGPGR